MNRTAIVADARIDGPGGDGSQLFRQLEQLPALGCRDLLLLGDLFHVWVGSRKYETEAIRRFVELAARLRAGGLRIHYVEGNRDFFLADSPYRTVFDRYGLELEFETGGRRVLAVHGDRANPDDRAYRFWALVSKSAPVSLLMRRLPQALARRLVNGAERQIARTNQRYRHSIPERVLREYSRSRLQQGFDLLVMGHFHQPAEFTFPEGEARVIDAWFNSRKLEWLP